MLLSTNTYQLIIFVVAFTVIHKKQNVSENSGIFYIKADGTYTNHFTFKK
jgi:hypothetical protein